MGVRYQNRTFSDIFSDILEMTYPEHIKKRAIELKEGLSARKVVEALGTEFPGEAYLPFERTIRRWHKDKPAIFIGSEQKTPSSVTGNWRDHYGQLTAVADGLLANGLRSVLERRSGRSSEDRNESYQVDYILDNRSGVGDPEVLTKEQLSDRLELNRRFVVAKHTRWFVYVCFLPHLEAELPDDVKAEGFWVGIIEEKPYELIHTLRVLAAKGIFKGTCPVCEGWQ